MRGESSRFCVTMAAPRPSAKSKKWAGALIQYVHGLPLTLRQRTKTKLGFKYMKSMGVPRNPPHQSYFAKLRPPFLRRSGEDLSAVKTNYLFGRPSHSIWRYALKLARVKRSLRMLSLCLFLLAELCLRVCPKAFTLIGCLGVITLLFFRAVK